MDMPDNIVQILMLAGYVHDVSPLNWDLLREEIDLDKNQLLQVEDIYGGQIYLNPKMITSTRESTPESSENYRTAHQEDNQNGFQES